MGCGTSQQSVTNVAPLGIDLYERKELIGVGHHARVYRCIHQKDKKEYAIKVIDQLRTQPNFQHFKDHYLQLMPRLKQLTHAKVLSFLHFQLSQKELSLVMQLSKEGSLKKHIQKEGKLLEEHIAPIVEQIVEGLCYLHSNGIIHGDLKTNNVFLFEQNTVKVSDFAIAELYDVRLLSKQHQAKSKKQGMFARGDSLPYMAPQVIKNLGMDYKGDVWSVGCVVIEMLTGKVPWVNMAPTFQQSFKTICMSKFPPFPQNISKQCKSFLESCLAVNPAKRSSAKQLLSHPFIQKFSKNKEPCLELQSNQQQKLQQIDKTNRVLSKKSNNQNQKQLELKTSTLSQMKYFDENSEGTPSRFGPNKPENIRIQKSAKKNAKQSTSSKLVGQASFSKDFASVSKEDILPEILQDEQEANVVFLNNKKVKMSSPSAKHFQGKVRTEQTDLASSRQYRNSIQVEESNDRIRVVSKRDGLNDSLEDIGRRMETQPNLLHSQFDHNKDYFKKPLKLLKKKINQRKQENSNSNNNLSGSFTTNNESSYISVQKVINGEKANKSKIRSNTESSREQIIINTQLAKAERDRYINEQLVIKKQREEDKLNWERQLKKEAEFLKKELSHRYAYPYTSIPL